MCGRFTLVRFADILDIFPWVRGTPADAPCYNIAPSHAVLAVVEDRFERLIWGLIPSWAKDSSIGNRMINARAETLAQKPAFRSAYERRRCLIAADGFYEWRSEGGRGKTPVYIRMKTGRPFAFAGLWDSWHAPDGRDIRSCTIITTPANELIAPIHDRMPAIIPPTAYRLWLQADTPPAQLASLLVPYFASEMQACPVSRAVNSPALDSPECISPVTGEKGLFG